MCMWEEKREVYSGYLFQSLFSLPSASEYWPELVHALWGLVQSDLDRREAAMRVIRFYCCIYLIAVLPLVHHLFDFYIDVLHWLEYRMD